MKKNTLILALVFVILFSYVYFVERKHPAPAGGGNANTPIFTLKADDIQQIEIHRPDADVVLKRSGGSDWVMSSPVADVADASQANGLAQNLSTLTSMNSIAKKENLEAYGFTPDSVQLKAETQSGNPIELRLGHEAPTQQGYYAYIPATGKLELIPSSLAQTLLQPVDAWRDHAVVSLTPDKIEKVVIQHEKSKPIELDKIKKMWWLVSPLKSKALEDKAAGLLSSITSMRISEFAPPPEAAQLISPSLTIKLWETGDKNPKTIVVGGKTDKGYLAMTLGRQYPYFLPASAVKPFDLDPISFKDYHLLAFDKEDITKIEVLKGTKLYTFTKEGKNWTVTTPDKSDLPGWHADMLLTDLQLLLQPESLPVKPKPVARPQVIVTLWEGQEKVAGVAVGEKEIINRNMYLPVEIEPSKKLAWSNAQFLVRDLIW